MIYREALIEAIVEVLMESSTMAPMRPVGGGNLFRDYMTLKNSRDIKKLKKKKVQEVVADRGYEKWKKYERRHRRGGRLGLFDPDRLMRHAKSR